MARAKDIDKPSQIIEAAFEVFGRTGYEATLVKEIADRAGISAGTVYTYFHDKRELFDATAREGWSRFLDQIRDLVESEGPAEDRLLQLLQIGFDSLRRHLPLLRGMLFESSQANILQENIDQLCMLVERLLMGRTAGGLNPAVDATSRRSSIRFTVIGVLFSAALAQPDRVEQEMAGLRKTVMGMLSVGAPGRANGA